MKKIILVMASIFILVHTNVVAQRAGVGPHRRVVVVRPSPFKPARVIVYHPYWGPKLVIHRRWVFFPKYNIYWDNWRNHYVFLNGTRWISQATMPPALINVNLSTEKHYELKENEDDVDDVYKRNDAHKTEYNN
jgi:hypothetical protein